MVQMSSSRANRNKTKRSNRGGGRASVKGGKGAAPAVRVGRPTAARVEAINRAILSAGRAEFVKSGYEAARMETVAAVAGVSKGTLYGRYPTKEALLRGVISDRVAAWSQNWRPDGRPVPNDLRHRLKDRARKLMEYTCSDRYEELERLFASAAASRELRRLRHEVGHQRIVQVIAQDLAGGVSDRVIEPRTAIQVAEMLMAMLYGWWRAQQEVRRVGIEEALAYADAA